MNWATKLPPRSPIPFSSDSESDSDADQDAAKSPGRPGGERVQLDGLLEGSLERASGKAASADETGANGDVNRRLTAAGVDTGPRSDSPSPPRRATTAPHRSAAPRRVSSVPSVQDAAKEYEQRKIRHANTAKYTRWTKGKGKGARRHLPSSDAYIRRQRIARASKLDPDFVKLVKDDLRQEFAGGGGATISGLKASIEYLQRNMGATQLRCWVQRRQHARISSCFNRWKYKLAAPEFAELKGLLDDAQSEAEAAHEQVARLAEEHQDVQRRADSQQNSLEERLEHAERLNAELEESSATALGRVNDMSGMLRKQAMLSLLVRMKNALVSRAWSSWRLEAVDQRMRTFRHRRAVAMWTRSTERKALLSWRHVARSRRRHRAMLRRSAVRMVMRLQSKTFEHWNDFAYRRGFLRRFLRKIARTTDVGNLLYTLHHWHSVARRMTVQGERARMRTAFEEEAARLKLYAMTRTLGRLVHATKTAAWNTWWDVVETERRHKHLIKTSLARIRQRKLTGALNRWKASVSQLTHRRELVRRILGRLRNARMHVGFNSWNRWVNRDALVNSEKRQKQRQIERVLKRLLNSLQNKGFGSWAAEVEAQRRRERLLARAASRMRHRRASAALSKWIEFVDNRVHNRRLLKRVLGRLANSKLNSAFRQWIAVVRFEQDLEDEAERQAHQMLRVLKRLCNAYLTKGFNAWGDMVAQRRRYDAIMSRSVARMKNQKLTAAWAAWEDYTVERIRQRNLLLRILKRAANRELAPAWRSWRHIVEFAGVEAERLRVKQAQMLRVLNRIVKRELAIGFGKWWHAVVQHRRYVSLLQRSVGRMQHRALAGACNRWEDYVRERRHQRRLVGKVFDRVTKRELFAGLNTWLKYTQHHRDAEAAKQYVHKRREAHLMIRVLSRLSNTYLALGWRAWTDSVAQYKHYMSLLSRTVGRMKNQRMAVAFTSWCDKVVENKRMRFISNRAAAKWRNRFLGSAFLSWADTTEFRIRARKILRRVLGKLANAKLGAGWRSWVLFIDEARAQEEKLARQRVLMGRILRRLLHSGLNRGFGTWWTEVERYRAYLVGLRRTHARWTRKRLAAAYNTWHSNFMYLRATRSKLERAVRKMQLRIAAMALNGWRSAVSEKLRHRRLLNKSVMRLKKRKLSAAYLKWDDWVQTTIHTRTLLTKVLGRLMNSKLNAGWGAWSKYVRDMQQLEMALRGERAASAEEELRRRKMRRMHAILSRLQNAKLNAAWDTWWYQVEGHRRYISLLKRSAARWRHKKLAMGFLGWLNAVLQRQLNRRRIRKSVARMVRRKLAACFTSWCEFAEELRQLKLRDKSLHTSEKDARRWRQALLRRAAARMQNRVLTMTLNRWVDAVETAKRNRVAVERCLARWRNKTMGAAFYFIADIVAERKRNRAILKRAARKWELRRMGAAYAGWTARVAQRKRARALVNKIVRRMQNRDLLMGWNPWWEATRYAKTCEVCGAEAAVLCAGCSAAPPPESEPETSKPRPFPLNVPKPKDTRLERLENGWRIDGAKAKLPNYHAIGDVHCLFAHSSNVRTRLKRAKEFESIDSRPNLKRILVNKVLDRRRDASEKKRQKIQRALQNDLAVIDGVFAHAAAVAAALNSAQAAAAADRCSKLRRRVKSQECQPQDKATGSVEKIELIRAVTSRKSEAGLLVEREGSRALRALLLTPSELAPRLLSLETTTKGRVTLPELRAFVTKLLKRGAAEWDFAASEASRDKVAAKIVGKTTSSNGDTFERRQYAEEHSPSFVDRLNPYDSINKNQKQRLRARPATAGPGGRQHHRSEYSDEKGVMLRASPSASSLPRFASGGGSNAIRSLRSPGAATSASNPWGTLGGEQHLDTSLNTEILESTFDESELRPTTAPLSSSIDRAKTWGTPLDRARMMDGLARERREREEMIAAYESKLADSKRTATMRERTLLAEIDAKTLDLESAHREFDSEVKNAQVEAEELLAAAEDREAEAEVARQKVEEMLKHRLEAEGARTEAELRCEQLRAELDLAKATIEQTSVKAAMVQTAGSNTANALVDLKASYEAQRNELESLRLQLEEAQRETIRAYDAKREAEGAVAERTAAVMQASRAELLDEQARIATLEAELFEARRVRKQVEEKVSRSERANRLLSVEAERDMAALKRNLESEAGKARMLAIERDALQQALQNVQAEFLDKLEQRGANGAGNGNGASRLRNLATGSKNRRRRKR